MRGNDGGGEGGIFTGKGGQAVMFRVTCLLQHTSHQLTLHTCVYSIHEHHNSFWEMWGLTGEIMWWLSGGVVVVNRRRCGG